MNNDVLAFAQVMAVLVPSLVILMVTGAFIQRFVKKGNQPPAPRLPAEDSLRLERLEHAVDAIAIEVERISEAQRFTTKLLSERSTEHLPR